MSSPSPLRLRSAAVALAATATLVGGATAARAAPGPTETAHQYRDFVTVTCQETCTSDLRQNSAATEVRTFTGPGIGGSPSQAVDSAVRTTYRIAQSAGWQTSQCHVRATSVRSTGGGLYSAVAELFCQR
ncbi:hypothetical protein [Streptomyces sp. NPDC094049]|uniref:hypothetical protein n=1 Tax=Streptomyces sp. NPDC094049 TaxID=3154987 RepID=UPI00332D5718